MVTKPVPVMGTQGFVDDKDPSTKFGTLMAHLFESNASQSNLYAGTISSMAAIMQQGGTDLSVLTGLLKDRLTAYFSRYYDQASVNAQVVASDASSVNLTIRLEIRLHFQGQSQLEMESFTSTNSVLKRVFDSNNYGT